MWCVWIGWCVWRMVCRCPVVPVSMGMEKTNDVVWVVTVVRPGLDRMGSDPLGFDSIGPFHLENNIASVHEPSIEPNPRRDIQGDRRQEQEATNQHGVGHVHGTYVQRFLGQDGASKCRGSRPFHQKVRANTSNAALTSTSKAWNTRNATSGTSCHRMGWDEWKVACVRFGYQAFGFFVQDGFVKGRFGWWIHRWTTDDEDVEEEKERESGATPAAR